MSTRLAGLAVLAVGALLLPLIQPVGAAHGTDVPPLCYPVAGRDRFGTANVPGYTTYWSDTYWAARSGGRSHWAQDLMSTGSVKMRPVLAVVDGRIAQIQYNNASGNYLVIHGDDGWYYVYIHLNNDTPGTDDGQATFEQAFVAGLHENQRVTAGQHIAYLGDSGNAESTAPHLHFEAREPLKPGQQYYDNPTSKWAWNYADRANPVEALKNAAHCDLGEVPVNRWAPFVSVGELIDRQYRDFLLRAPDPSGLSTWTTYLTTSGTPVGFIAQLVHSNEFGRRISPVARLYKAFFLRVPDTAGLWNWVAATSAGMTLAEVAGHFANSSEFRNRYGALDNGAYVDLVYRNVLERDPDPEGRAAWLRELDSGSMTRGELMLGFSESNEYRTKNTAWVDVVLVYLAMLQREPDPSGLQTWTQFPLNVVVDGVFRSPEYARRVGGLRAG